MPVTRRPAARALLIGFLLAFMLPARADLPAPVFESEDDIATAGYYRLHWRPATPRGSHFELQEAPGADFSQPVTVYLGPDLATVMSGRPDGDYYYRVRARSEDAGSGAWSAPVRIRVAHHPLPQALAFLAAGAVVFAGTTALIFAGGRADRKKGPGG